MPYRDDPRPTDTSHEGVARALGVLGGCALVLPVVGLLFAVLPLMLRTSSALGLAITWAARAGFVALGISAIVLGRRIEGPGARRAATAGGVLVIAWGAGNVVLDLVSLGPSPRTFYVVFAIATALSDVGVIAIAYAVAQVRHARIHDPGLALRACVASLGGSLCQSALTLAGAEPSGQRSYAAYDDEAVMVFFFRVDNVLWTVPFALLAVGALERRRLRSIGPLVRGVDDDDPLPSSRTAATREVLVLFRAARALVAAGTVAAIAISLPSLVLFAATLVGTRGPIGVDAAARTLIIPHGAFLAALGMAFYETRAPEARDASTGPRALVLIAGLGVALADLLSYAGGWFSLPRSFDTETIYAMWSLSAAVAVVALALVAGDVHRRARVGIVRRSDADEIPRYTEGTDGVMRVAAIAGGIAAVSTSCGTACSTPSSTTTLWGIAGAAALAASIAAGMAAARARRLAGRLESIAPE